MPETVEDMACCAVSACFTVSASGTGSAPAAIRLLP